MENNFQLGDIVTIKGQYQNLIITAWSIKTNAICLFQSREFGYQSIEVDISLLEKVDTESEKAEDYIFIP